MALDKHLATRITFIVMAVGIVLTSIPALFVTEFAWSSYETVNSVDIGFADTGGVFMTALATMTTELHVTNNLIDTEIDLTITSQDSSGKTTNKSTKTGTKPNKEFDDDQLSNSTFVQNQIGVIVAAIIAFSYIMFQGLLICRPLAWDEGKIKRVQVMFGVSYLLVGLALVGLTQVLVQSFNGKFGDITYLDDEEIEDDLEILVHSLGGGTWSMLDCDTMCIAQEVAAGLCIISGVSILVCTFYCATKQPSESDTQPTFEEIPGSKL
jgi:hypothetical protein